MKKFKSKTKPIESFAVGDMVCFEARTQNKWIVLVLDDPSMTHPWKLPRKGPTFKEGDTGLVVESTTFFDPISMEDRAYYKIATSVGVGWVFPTFLAKVEDEP